MYSESGYCFNFFLYRGKKLNDSETTGPLISQVVIKMLYIVDNSSFYVVYFDNFFASHSFLVQMRKKVLEQRKLLEMREQQTVL